MTQLTPTFLELETVRCIIRLEALAARAETSGNAKSGGSARKGAASAYAQLEMVAHVMQQLEANPLTPLIALSDALRSRYGINRIEALQLIQAARELHWSRRQ